MRKKKITVALFAGRYEGKVTSVSELILGLDENRFDTMFIYLSGYGADGNLTEKIGRRFFYLSDRKRVRTFNLLILRKLIKILKEQKVDIIHSQSHKCTVYGTLAAIIARTPVVLAHVHGLDRSRNLRRKLVNLLLFRRINRLIPVANKVKEDVLRNNLFLSEDKLFVLENSVDYERFAKISISKEDAKRLLGTSPDAFVFGTIGRLAPTKGLPYLIEAFAKVKQQMPSAQLVLVGDGRLRNELEQRAAKTLCADSIHFLGHRNNTPELLKAMDVFVLSSIAEGMPRAILEAMAGGVPCVATGVGGIPELLDGGNMGLLVPLADADALAQAMLTVANMPKDKLDKLIQNAQSRATQAYSHDVVRKKLARLYESEFKACTKQ